MATPRVAAAGGLAAIWYGLRMWLASGPVAFLRRMFSRNACKTCALGMGGQGGGMRNEAGHFPEVCKKSLQAQAADMQPAIAEGYFRDTPLSLMERLSSRSLERLGRLAFPLVAEPGDTHFRRIGWDEANARMAAGFRAARPEETFFYMSGRSSNEAAFLLQLVARAYGTPHVHNCSYYCHNASGVALNRVYGSGTASVVLDDLTETDLVVVVGANPASNHPRLITQLMRLRRRGGRVLVINPLKELGLVRFRVPSDWRSLLFGSQISDLYLQPHIGGDVALFKALLKGLLERGHVDEAFLRQHTSGWEGVRDDVGAAAWPDLVRAAGVAREDIDRAVEMLGRAERGIIMWAMGLTHHQNGVDNILALANVALTRGWVGRRGAGLLPIRGHSNVQGVGSMGVSPAVKQGFAQALERRYGVAVQQDGGQHTYASMCAAAEGRVRAALLLGGNLYASNPDQAWAAAALRRVPLLVHVSTKLNTGHVCARGETTLILPALARDEEAQPTTQESMFNFVRLSEGGSPAVAGEMRSEVEIIAGLAERVLPEGRFDWQALRSHAQLRAAMAEVVAGYDAAARLDATQEEFQIPGRTFHAPAFATPDGRAHLHVTPLPPERLAHDGLRLMTLRSEGQFNSVVYDEEDLYRGNRRRDVIMMAQGDADRLGLREGQRVRVTTSAGTLEVHVAVVDIRAGNAAMYYPEANVLVPQIIDPESKTPAFKCVSARVEALAPPALRAVA